MTLTKQKFEEIMQQVRETERDELNKLPAFYAVEIQSGYLVGYAQCWNKVWEAILKELE